MSKNNTALVLSILLGWLALIFLPWWVGATATCIIGYLLLNELIRSFVIGFIALFTVWTTMALWQNLGTHVSVSDSMGIVFGEISGALVYILTGLIGGITGGLGSLTGTLLRKTAIKQDFS